MKKWLLLTAIDIVGKVLEKATYDEGSPARNLANVFKHHMVPVLIKQDLTSNRVEPAKKRRQQWSIFAEG